MSVENKTSVPLSQLEVLQELEGIMTGQWITDLATTAAILFQHVTDINWVGFYLTDTAGKVLWLGPFQGLPACTLIPFAKGVCGTSAQTKQSMLVLDVDLFPGHIVCDSRSRSEVVVPLISEQKVIGVLDVDSATTARFTKTDLLFFENVVKILLQKNKL